MAQTQINKQFLEDVGITGLTEEEELQTLESLAQTLEMRVGMALASQLTDEELEKVPEDIDENWLEEMTGRTCLDWYHRSLRSDCPDQGSAT